MCLSSKFLGVASPINSDTTLPGIVEHNVDTKHCLHTESVDHGDGPGRRAEVALIQTPRAKWKFREIPSLLLPAGKDKP